MKIFNRHERLIAAPPERIAPLIAGFAPSRPTRLAPAAGYRNPRAADVS